MISILIPVYNNYVTDLVTTLKEQLNLIDIKYEIICLDDKSESKFIDKNIGVEKLGNVKYLQSEHNLGRTKTRHELANLANYDWLLFLDSDVFPKTDLFIRNYINKLNADYDAVFGGFAYKRELPEPTYRLRWKYGINQEEKPAGLRNNKPYKIIISANFLIKKALFMSINSEVSEHNYGLDNIFGAKLKNKKASVNHIDNEVYHLGIESSANYLKKKEESALTVLKYYKQNKIMDHQNDLLSLFLFCKRYKINHILSLIYKGFNPAIKKNLTGTDPSVKLLQLYRISFICYKDLHP